jgi:hemoglobin
MAMPCFAYFNKIWGIPPDAVARLVIEDGYRSRYRICCFFHLAGQKSTGMLTPDTMFERYGGLAFVTRFVLSFYDRVLASVRLAPFFANSDMQRLVEHQAKFISSVMGGPTSYSNAVLRETHEHLDIDDQAFDEMIFLFKTTLKDFKISDTDVEAIIADLNARRKYVVNGRSKKM